MTAVLGLAVAYVVGAIPVGFLVARAFGVGDIRVHGSGNIGATNVLRTAGRWPAVLTLAGDVGKGFVAALLGGALGGPGPGVEAASAVAAIAGNCWSPFLGFRGGKGGATGLGAFLRVAPLATLPAALVFVVVTASFRVVSLGTILAAGCVPLGALLLGQPWPVVASCLAAAALIVGRHHDNIRRLLAGTERRLGERGSEG